MLKTFGWRVACWHLCCRVTNPFCALRLKQRGYFMKIRGQSFFLTMLASGIVSAQALPKYEIHECLYTTNADGGGHVTEYWAKVIDRANNTLWLCIAWYQNNNVQQLSGKCVHGVNNTAAQPNLAQLVTADSISATTTSPATPKHWWLINPQTGAVSFCWSLGCTPAPYQ
jgi:hypothetical protein